MMSEVNRYEAEAEQTRGRISSTVEAITGRLDPSRLLDSVTDQSSALVGETRRIVREHPVALGLIGLSLGLLLAQRNRIAGRSSYAFETSQDDRPGSYGLYEGADPVRSSRLKRGWSNVRSGVGDAGTRARSSVDEARSAVADRASSTVHSVRASASSAAETVRATASDVADRARAVAASAADRIGAGARDVSEQASTTLRAAREGAVDLSHQARVTASRGVDATVEAVQENPATAIVVGFAAGALIAFLLPGGDGDRSPRDPFDTGPGNDRRYVDV